MSGTERPIAFVTGAASGIGAAVARRFAAAGFRLWLTDVNAAGLHALAETFEEPIVDVCDQSDHDALEALCRRLETSTSTIEVCLINAGVIKAGNALDLDRAEIDFHFDVNLRAAAHLNQALARKMVAQGSGRLISTVSAAGLIALPRSAAYAASKFGLRGYLLSLSQELKGTGVSVACVYPGAIDTPMLRYEALNGGSALNFLGEPLSTDDVALVVDNARKGNRLEYFAPASTAFVARLSASCPRFASRLAGWLESQGERGRERFIKSRGLDKTPAQATPD